MIKWLPVIGALVQLPFIILGVTGALSEVWYLNLVAFGICTGSAYYVWSVEAQS